MKTYEGRYEGFTVRVTVDGRPLNPRHDLRNHSPNGFEWGYGGSGPAQLALAILAEHLGNVDAALDLYQRFKWTVIAELPRRNWTLTSDEVEAALQTIRTQESLQGDTA